MRCVMRYRELHSILPTRAVTYNSLRPGFALKGVAMACRVVGALILTASIGGGRVWRQFT